MSPEKEWLEDYLFPIGSMYGIFTYIESIFMVNVAKYIPFMDPMGLKWAPLVGGHSLVFGAVSIHQLMVVCKTQVHNKTVMLPISRSSRMKKWGTG